jgi:hypothetical protein
MLDVIADTAEVNEDIRYIYSATCVAIRRDSAKVCEACGKGAKIRGKQTDIYVLPEQKCLCSKCYALEIDTVETQKLK